MTPIINPICAFICQDRRQRVQQVYKKSDRNQYFAELRKFLRETGYVK